MSAKVIFIFLDGVGLGPAGPQNPFSQHPMPWLESNFGARLLAGQSCRTETRLLQGIDACLGVEGIPQSATGQTAIFTGINAARHLGYHYPAFPEAELKKMIAAHSIFRHVIDAGLKATFANAYTPGYFKMVAEGRREHSVTTLSVMAADSAFRTLTQLQRDEAVYWDITNRYLVAGNHTGIKPISPPKAGGNLAKLSHTYDLVVFECFIPDMVGHKRDREQAESFVRTLDGFLQGIAEKIDRETTVLISSDHGNMENLHQGGHTIHPVPLLAWGPGVSRLAAIGSITEIKQGILGLLDLAA